MDTGIDYNNGAATAAAGAAPPGGAYGRTCYNCKVFSSSDFTSLLIFL
jgi:hypothetical protein